MFMGNNYTVFTDLPTHMKSVYRLKSIMIMAELIYDESHDILLNFVNKNKIDVCSNFQYHLLKNIF